MIYQALVNHPGEPIPEICGRCNLLPTKPGQEPGHLVAAIQTAIDLDNLKSAGAVFQYPHSLTCFEWTCLQALASGRAESEANGLRERQAKTTQEAKRAELEQLRRR